MHYLRNQFARVCWDNSVSGYHIVNKGVRQGGLISPMLFKFYIDSMVNSISASHVVGCSLGPTKINIIAYADDIVLLAKSECNLSTLYKMLKSEISELQLKINVKKNKAVIFSGVIPDLSYPTVLSLDGDQISVEKCFKYLGHYIERGLEDTTNTKVRLNDFYAKFNSVFRNFHKLKIQTLLFLFNTYCLPNFGIELWNSNRLMQNQHFKVFETAFSNALKRMLSVPRYASSHIAAEKCNQLLFRHLVSKIQLRYYQRLRNHKNAIIRLNFPFLRNGFHTTFVENNFKINYKVNINDNDIDALYARIGWTQRNEQRSRICPFFDC